MAINRYKEHLLVFTEDSAYNSMMIGVEKSAHVNSNLIDTKNPFGGSLKVFGGLEEHLHLLNKYPKCYILLLTDFDGTEKNLDPLYYYNSKMNKFKEIITQEQRKRVFLLGTNCKEAEDLKKHFQCNLETIGELLIANCPNKSLDNWQNIHLDCNLNEIKRMKEAKIFSWLLNNQKT